jgi:hypothetical protein
MATTRRSDNEDQNEPVEQVAEAAQQASQAARERTRKNAEQAGRVAQAAVDANSHVARAGAEIMQRNAEAVHHTLQSGTEMMARLAERSTAQLTRVMNFSGDEAHKAVQQSSNNVVAVMQSGAALAEVTQSIWVESANFARDCMEHNLEHFDHLLRCRTPQELVELQSGALKDNFGGLLGYVRKMAERSMRMAEEANKRFSEHINLGRQSA